MLFLNGIFIFTTNAFSTRSWSLISKSKLYIMNIKKTVSIDFGPLKDKCEKYQMARWTYRQKITSYALMLFHFYRQLFELFKFPYIHRPPPAFFFTLLATNETPFSLLRQLLHTLPCQVVSL